jgi:sulfur-oxidizing protein SoxX
MNRVIIVALASFLLQACNPESRGFNLPPGNAENGKSTFTRLGCNNCHSVDGVVEWNGGDESPINIRLGGPTTRVKTYGDLVTSIIHPSHKISQSWITGVKTEDGASRMKNYNDVLLVSDLIDLVEFLQSEYEIIVPDYYAYH